MLAACRWAATLAICTGAGAVLGACGSSHHQPAQTQSASQAAASAPTPPPVTSELSAAEHPTASEFPPARGRSLKQLVRLVSSIAQLGAANGTFTPGRQRLAFALTTNSQRFIYAPTALYIARAPSSPAAGPFLAPADPMTVPAPDRSQQNSAPGGLQAIYSAELPLSRPGVYDVLSLTRAGSRLTAATGEVAVAARSPIPGLAQRPPDIATDTAATVHGNTTLLTTRRPPEQMHSVSLNHVLGRRPVVLLFSTPELCTSRICGPVTDEAVYLQHRYGSRVAFIHQEVYVDNQPTRGLRPQLKAFHLETEPWLFAINRRGVITARLEGAFGLNEFRGALESALR